MKRMNKYMDMLDAHKLKYGIIGLLPQNLPKLIFQIISAEDSSFDSINMQIKIKLLVSIVACLVIKDIEIDVNNIAILALTEDEFAEKLNIYELNIHVEEIRKSGLIKMSKSSLPTLENILDEHRDLSINVDAETMEYFERKNNN